MLLEAIVYMTILSFWSSGLKDIHDRTKQYDHITPNPPYSFLLNNCSFIPLDEVNYYSDIKID